MAVDEFGREIPSPAVSGHRDGAIEYHESGSSALGPYAPGGASSSYTAGSRGGGSFPHRQHRRSSSPVAPRPRSPVDGPRRPNHPSLQYVDEPLLCEFLWKEKNPTQQQQEEDIPDAEDSKGKESCSTYDEYRRKYCLNYIRAFFNHHLDDVWFRYRYSPAMRQRFAMLERNRSLQEAKALCKEVSLDSEKDGSVVSAAASAFLQGARLGGGLKDQKQQLSPPPSHLFSWQQPGSSVSAFLLSEIPPAVTDEQLVMALLNHCSLPLHDHSRQSHNGKSSSSASSSSMDLTIYGSTHIPTSGRNVLQRQAIVVGQTNIIQNIWKALLSTAKKGGGSTSGSAHRNEQVPRKEDGDDDHEQPPRPMDLEVDCTDPYGRSEYDADGRGGAPADGLAVPSKKSTVAVQLLSNSVARTSTVVLSAALSAKSRHHGDRIVAQRLAKALDEKIQNPNEYRLEAVVRKIFGETEDDLCYDEGKESDILDVCIAYLRRVHLVSFYNGCDQPAQAVADVLTGKHPASTIHLRLKNADSILETIASEDPNPALPESEDVNASTSTRKQQVKDMLVQRLDDSIDRAMQQHSEWMSSPSYEAPPLHMQLGLLPEIVEQANQIQSAENQIRDQWLNDHSIIDDDQRARCSFHFCHKLFKDTSFLQKHLLKKHVEYLTAEQAKCHDDYMMKAWDAAGQRPVPDVLVDCGSRFGFVATTVTGRVPDCVDPEPELWKREEERRDKEKHLREASMRARRDELRQQHSYHSTTKEQGSSSSNRGPSTHTFVDVDDMKEEKVEMSFDHVDLPLAVSKKKKKKRKLL